MQTSALASGSSGNCFFIESNKVSFLIDAGISCRQVKQRMDAIGKEPAELKGIFITHEHTDHIKGVDVLSREYSLPVYLTKKCYEMCADHLPEKDLVKFIEKDKLLDID